MKGKLDAMKADVQMEETLQLKLKTKKEAQVLFVWRRVVVVE